MPVFLLGPQIEFPSAEMAEDGLVAIGGDLRPERLIRAYADGIFPWYSEGEPILWHSPDPRFVLTPQSLRVSRSLRKAIRARPYRVTCDQAFREVISACGEIPRRHESGTWITNEMRDAYTELHRRGVAHSVESWRGDELVGGLYGVSLGAAFFGESMFARADDASKIAFVLLVQQLERWDIRLIDCQVHTDHLERFGAGFWPRRRYLSALRRALDRPTRRGPWQLDADLGDGAERNRPV